MTSNQVQFCDLNGGINLCISKTNIGELDKPANATVLLDGRIIVADENGVFCYDGSGECTKQLAIPEKGKVHGIVPTRDNGGMLGIFLFTYKKEYKERD